MRKSLIKLSNSIPLGRAALRQAILLYCRRWGTEVRVRGDVISIRKGDRIILIHNKLFIYVVTLSQLFDVFFTAVQCTEKNGLRVVDYSAPALHTLKNGLQFEFAAFPEEMEATDTYFRWYRPAPGDTVFDIGANCGLSSYHFSKLVGPSGRVICFEPDPINLELLRRNIDRHQLGNVTIVEAAIGGSDGMTQFSAEGTIGSQMVGMRTWEPIGTVITVPLITLGTAFERHGVPQLCKVDIEGAEVDVFESGIECISKARTQYVVDTIHKIDGEYTDRRVEEAFRCAGYETETIREAGFLQTTYGRPRS